MAWSLNALAQFADTNALSTYTTGSYTPTANEPVFAWVVNTKASPVSTPTSLSGNGLTWNLIAGVENAATTIRGGLYWAMGASPSTGALSVNFSGNQTGCIIHVFELTGADPSGTIVQSNPNNASGAASLTLTLSAFGSASNATVACFGGLRQAAINHDSGAGMSEIYDNGYATPATEGESQWKNGAATSITGTWSAGTADILGVACEVKLATAVTTKVKDVISRGVIARKR